MRGARKAAWSRCAPCGRWRPRAPSAGCSTGRSRSAPQRRRAPLPSPAPLCLCAGTRRRRCWASRRPRFTRWWSGRGDQSRGHRHDVTQARIAASHMGRRDRTAKWCQWTPSRVPSPGRRGLFPWHAGGGGRRLPPKRAPVTTGTHAGDRRPRFCFVCVLCRRLMAECSAPSRLRHGHREIGERDLRGQARCCTTIGSNTINAWACDRGCIFPSLPPALGPHHTCRENKPRDHHVVYASGEGGPGACHGVTDGRRAAIGARQRR